MPAPTGGQQVADTNPAAVPSYVPAQYRSLVKWAAGVIGIPVTVVAAQIELESSYNTEARSPTGALGIAQFEPGTWSGEGCSGSPDNPNDAFKCYAKLMYKLVRQYHGSIRDALAAYNAGPGDLSAGYGYADQILSNASVSDTATAAGGTGGAGGSAPSTSSANCVFGNVPGVFGLWGGFCLLDKKTVRVMAAIGLTIGAAVTGAIALSMIAKATGVLQGAAKTAAPVAALAGPEAAVAAGLASDMSKARKPSGTFRSEIQSGQRPAVSPGRRTGSRPAPSRAATSRPQPTRPGGRSRAGGRAAATATSDTPPF